MDAGPCNRFHIDHVFEIFKIWSDQVDLGSGRSSHRLVEGHAAHILHSIGDDLIGAVLHPPGGTGVSGSAVGRVVFETAVLRWVMGG